MSEEDKNKDEKPAEIKVKQPVAIIRQISVLGCGNCKLELSKTGPSTYNCDSCELDYAWSKMLQRWIITNLHDVKL